MVGGCTDLSVVIRLGPILIQVEGPRQKSPAKRSELERGRNLRTSLVRAFWGGVKNLAFQRPLLAVFQMNLRCNSSCGYCNLPLNEGRYEMTRDEIQQVFAGLYEEGVRLVFSHGGEPLFRNDLSPIIQAIVHIVFHVTLITNGTRFTPSLVKEFEDLAVSLSISLDTLDLLRYERIRGADQLGHVLAGLDLLEGYRHPKFLTCIVSEVHRDEAHAVVRFARSRGFLPVVGAYHWDVGLYGKQDLMLMYERQQVRIVFERLLKKICFRLAICDSMPRTTSPGCVGNH